MTFIKDDCIARIPSLCGNKGGFKTSHYNARNWYLGKNRITLGTVVIPEKYWGKRIRFKIEIVEEVGR